jgi:magnesium chelatase family protein
MIQRYVAKISGPLMDRIDIHIDVPAVNYKEMRSTHVPEDSARIRERVIAARQIQLQRFAGSRQKNLLQCADVVQPCPHILRTQSRLRAPA